ncbi:hypothetical protein FRC09_013347 [Ceratobasidium sp. 395]|nr:hypothetical protein FRC09_013347 [Ceratobasidium sp. 395]
MEDSSTPINDLNTKLGTVFSEYLTPESSLSPEATVERIVSIAKTHIEEHSNDPALSPSMVRRNSGPKRDTPGAETFFWSLWESLLSTISRWETDEQFKHYLDRAIGFVKALQASSEGDLTWTVWGEDTSIKALPLIGPSLREANNGPFMYGRPDDNELGRPEVQNALAGAPPATLVHDENIELTTKRRKGWLALQAFMARLWTDAGLDSFAVSSIWAVRDGLEDWPVVPPSIFDDSAPSDGDQRPVGEDTPAYRALMVESAAIWIRLAASQMYASTKIWGPNGNPDWPKNQGAPGHGGERWQGVDGMDKEKQRWALWREVLKDVVAWYDREEVGGRGGGWKVKEEATAALEAMYNAQQK